MTFAPTSSRDHTHPYTRPYHFSTHGRIFPERKKKKVSQRPHPNTTKAAKTTHINFLRKARPWLRMQEPIRVRNLSKHASLAIHCPSDLPNPSQKSKKHPKLTASGRIFASGPASFIHSFVLGISITPSTFTCATCTPLGPNSLARLCDSERRANLPVEKEAQSAEPFMAAVAPVKMRVGGCCCGEEEAEEEVEEGVEARRSGRTAREKRKAPRLPVVRFIQSANMI